MEPTSACARRGEPAIDAQAVLLPSTPASGRRSPLPPLRIRRGERSAARGDGAPARRSHPRSALPATEASSLRSSRSPRRAPLRRRCHPPETLRPGLAATREPTDRRAPVSRRDDEASRALAGGPLAPAVEKRRLLPTLLLLHAGQRPSGPDVADRHLLLPPHFASMAASTAASVTPSRPGTSPSGPPHPVLEVGHHVGEAVRVLHTRAGCLGVHGTERSARARGVEVEGPDVVVVAAGRVLAMKRVRMASST